MSVLRFFIQLRRKRGSVSNTLLAISIPDKTPFFDTLELREKGGQTKVKFAKVVF